MTHFTAEQLRQLAIEAVHGGRDDELRVLLGYLPLVRRDTYPLRHTLNVRHDQLIWHRATQAILERAIRILERTNRLAGFEETVSRMASEHFDRVVSEGQVFPPSASLVSSPRAVGENDPTRPRTTALVLVTSQVSDINTVLPREFALHPSDLRLDWRVDPPVQHELQRRYEKHLRQTQEQLLAELFAPAGPTVLSEVRLAFKKCAQALTQVVSEEEAHCRQLAQQIAHATQQAKRAHRRGAVHWYEQMKHKVRERRTLFLQPAATTAPSEALPPDRSAWTDAALDREIAPTIRDKIILEIRAEEAQHAARQAEEAEIPPPSVPTSARESAVFRELRRASVNINTLDEAHHSLLALAVHRLALGGEREKRLGIVAYLVHGGAELEYPDHYGVTPARKALHSNDTALIKLIATRKIQEVDYPISPRVAWYLKAQPVLSNAGPRSVKEHAEDYLAQRQATFFQRPLFLSLQRLFADKAISAQRIEEAGWLSTRASTALVDSDAERFAHAVRRYQQENTIKFGWRQERGSRLWSEVLAILHHMEAGFYGQRNEVDAYFATLKRRYDPAAAKEAGGPISQLQAQLQTQHQESTQALAAAALQRSEDRATIQTLSGQVEKNQATIQTLNDQVEKSQATIQALNGQVEELRMRRGEDQATIQRLNDQGGKNQAIIQTLSDQVENNNKQLAQLLALIAPQVRHADSVATLEIIPMATTEPPPPAPPATVGWTGPGQ